MNDRGVSARRLARLLAERMAEEGERPGAALTVDELLGRYVPYEVARGELELTTKAEYDQLVLRFLADRGLTVLRDPEVGEAAAEELETPEPGLGALEEHREGAFRLDLATISGGYRGAADSAPEREDGPDGSGEEGGTFRIADGEEEEVGDDAETGEAVEADDAGEGADDGAGWDPTGGVEARPAPDLPDPGGGAAEASEPGGPGSSPSGSTGSAAGAAEAGEAGPAADPDPGPTADGTPLGDPPDLPGECPSCGRAYPEEADVTVRYCPGCGAQRPAGSCGGCGAPVRADWSYCVACGEPA